jgi:STAS-like domain of unknown function (DUF4325)/Histidine kinase-like ATPase domain
MSKIRAKGEVLRRYIIENIDSHTDDISKVAAAHFGVTRQAVNKHLQRMVKEGALKPKGGLVRNRGYELAPLVDWGGTYKIGAPETAEDIVWRSDVLPMLGALPDNVIDIWEYCFTEMFNNAIDHSEGSDIQVFVTKTAAKTKILVTDNGIGIFKKIQERMGLLDERHAILELAKGKLTTDPKRHTGEGLFFTSRLVDDFDILSGGVYLNHVYGSEEDWIAERNKPSSGTHIFMELNNHTARTSKEVFTAFAGADDDYGFVRTVVPVKLAQYGNDKLISRSQAKRLLSRVELFKTVIFDFSGVETIGQAFADEIFRVFKNSHPNVTLYFINASEEVQQMIRRAESVNLVERTSEHIEDKKDQ